MCGVCAGSTTAEYNTLKAQPKVGFLEKRRTVTDNINPISSRRGALSACLGSSVTPLKFDGVEQNTAEAHASASIFLFVPTTLSVF